MKAFLLFGFLVASFSIHAQNTQFTPQEIETKNQILKAYTYYKKNIGNRNISSCEKDAQRFYENFAKELTAQAERSNTKTQKDQILTRANIIINSSPVISRGVCFYKFFIDMESLYFETFNGTSVENIVNKIIADDVTKKRIEQTANVVKMPMTEYNATFVRLEGVRGMEAFRGGIPLRIQLWERGMQVFVSYFEMFPEFGCTKDRSGRFKCN